MMGWMAPLRHQCAKLVFSENHQEREPSMSEITTIGLDLAKHVFQVHGIDPQALARALAIGIGVSGLFLTGLIAGIAVYAMRTALTDRDTG